MIHLLRLARRWTWLVELLSGWEWKSAARRRHRPRVVSRDQRCVARSEPRDAVAQAAIEAAATACLDHVQHVAPPRAGRPALYVPILSCPRTARTTHLPHSPQCGCCRPDTETPSRANFGETSPRERRSRTRLDETAAGMASHPIWSAAGQRGEGGPDLVRRDSRTIRESSGRGRGADRGLGPSLRWATATTTRATRSTSQ